jgi:hypothetical protein
MSHTEIPKPKRRGVPRAFAHVVPKSRVLRPFEKWLLNIFSSDIWVDSRQGGVWLTKLHEIASSHGCRLLCDQMYHWQESMYVPDYKKGGPTILAGGAANDTECSTAILHELGHHILLNQKRHPGEEIEGEEAAWHIAQELAQEFRLPLETKIKRTALYSYRYWRLLERTAGSKRKNRVRPEPRSWRLESSKRSSAASASCGLYSQGKRGKRHAKRYIKKTTVKAERRKPVADN